MSRSPDYVLKVKPKDEDNRDTTRIGAAWLNPNGSISIVLNPCVVISYNDEVLITLFPNT